MTLDKMELREIFEQASADYVRRTVPRDLEKYALLICIIDAYEAWKKKQKENEQ